MSDDKKINKEDYEKPGREKRAERIKRSEKAREGRKIRKAAKKREWEKGLNK